MYLVPPPPIIANVGSKKFFSYLGRNFRPISPQDEDTAKLFTHSVALHRRTITWLMRGEYQRNYCLALTATYLEPMLVKTSPAGEGTCVFFMEHTRPEVVMGPHMRFRDLQ